MDTSPRAGARGRTPRLAVLLLALAAPAWFTACAVNPATGERQLILIGEEQAIAMGRQGAAQVEDRIGVYDEGTVDEYVAEMGREMAAGTTRPDLPWSFEVADESTVNAFALPGGFIYVTRGILAYFNSGAELATVVGHEIGHVTARHSAEQMSRQQLATLGLGIGGLVSEEFARFRGLASAGLGVLFLKYGRDDERQADALGVQYMLRQGYDPREAIDVFEMLGRQSGGGGGLPTWLSTHPAPEDRVERIRAMLDTIPDARLRATRVARDAYLRRLDGMVFGQDPRDGYFRSSRFIHPGHEIAVEFPGGWERQHLPRLVAAGSDDGSAIVRWAASDSATREAAARALTSASNVQVLERRETRINGLPALVVEFRASTDQGELRGRAAFVDAGGQVMEVMGYATSSAHGRYHPVVGRFLQSVERVTEAGALDVEPMRVDLITVSGGATVASLRAERGAPVSAEVLARINAVGVDERLSGGRTIKWIVGEGPPE